MLRQSSAATCSSDLFQVSHQSQDPDVPDELTPVFSSAHRFAICSSPNPTAAKTALLSTLRPSKTEEQKDQLLENPETCRSAGGLPTSTCQISFQLLIARVFVTFLFAQEFGTENNRRPFYSQGFLLISAILAV